MTERVFQSQHEFNTGDEFGKYMLSTAHSVLSTTRYGNFTRFISLTKLGTSIYLVFSVIVILLIAAMFFNRTRSVLNRSYPVIAVIAYFAIFGKNILAFFSTKMLSRYVENITIEDSLSSGFLSPFYALHRDVLIMDTVILAFIIERFVTLLKVKNSLRGNMMTSLFRFITGGIVATYIAISNWNITMVVPIVEYVSVIGTIEIFIVIFGMVIPGIAGLVLTSQRLKGSADINKKTVRLYKTPAQEVNKNINRTVVSEVPNIIKREAQQPKATRIEELEATQVESIQVGEEAPVDQTVETIQLGEGVPVDQTVETSPVREGTQPVPIPTNSGSKKKVYTNGKSHNNSTQLSLKDISRKEHTVATMVKEFESKSSSLCKNEFVSELVKEKSINEPAPVEYKIEQPLEASLVSTDAPFAPSMATSTPQGSTEDLMNMSKDSLDNELVIINNSQVEAAPTAQEEILQGGVVPTAQEEILQEGVFPTAQEEILQGGLVPTAQSNNAQEEETETAPAIREELKSNSSGDSSSTLNDADNDSFDSIIQAQPEQASSTTEAKQNGLDSNGLGNNQELSSGTVNNGDHSKVLESETNAQVEGTTDLVKETTTATITPEESVASTDGSVTSSAAESESEYVPSSADESTSSKVSHLDDASPLQSRQGVRSRVPMTKSFSFKQNRSKTVENRQNRSKTVEDNGEPKLPCHEQTKPKRTDSGLKNWPPTPSSQ